MQASPRHHPPSRHATLARQTMLERHPTLARHAGPDRHTALAERPKRLYSRAAYSRVLTAALALRQWDFQTMVSTPCLSIQATTARFSWVLQMDSSAAVIAALLGFRVIRETAALPLPI